MYLNMLTFDLKQSRASHGLATSLLIKPGVQLYFHSGTCYIINDNFGLVKS